MPNTQRISQPLVDWSTEISAPQPVAPAASEGTFQYPPASMPADTPPAFQFPSASGAAEPPAGVSGPTLSAAPAASTGSMGPGFTAPAASTGSMGPGFTAPAASTGSMGPGFTAPAASTGSMGPSSADPAVSSVPAVRPANRHPAHNEFAGSTGDLNLQHHQPVEIIEAPTSTGEAFLGSLKAMLLRNRGNFVAATLLIGTQGTMVWEGILHEVGNDYFIIYQTGRQRYILCDIYALKYMEFYDTKQRELCEHLLQGNGSAGFC